MRHSFKGRYARDYGGNHLDAIRAAGSSSIILTGLDKKVCSVCKEKKPVKGSRRVAGKMVCEYCFDRTPI